MCQHQLLLLTTQVWTLQLKERFAAAQIALADTDPKPKEILRVMNCEGDGAPTNVQVKDYLRKDKKQRSSL